MEGGDRAGAGKRKGGRPSQRCGECDACKVWVGAKALPEGKKRERAVKKAQKTPCSRACPSQKKKRRGESDLLHAGGHGRQCRATEANAVVPDPAPRERPAYNNEAGYDKEAFDAYSLLVADCEEVARLTNSPTIKAESAGIIRGMRGLLDSNVRCEVDYVEARREFAHILFRWRKGTPVGAKAFIPTEADRNKCLNALNILDAAIAERETIVEEYVDAFGEEEGVHIYNELISCIPDDTKKAMPLVNMALRAWREMLEIDEDGNGWANLSAFDFDQWLENEVKRHKIGSPAAGKTSYELLMNCFPPKKAAAAVGDRTATAPSHGIFGVPLPATKPVASASTNIMVGGRSSKLKKLGERLRAELSAAGHLRRRYRYSGKAEEMARAALDGAMEENLPKLYVRDCRDAARQMEEVLFGVGGTERMMKTLAIFNDRAAVSEATASGRAAASEATATSGGDQNGRSSVDRLNSVIVRNLKSFLAMFKGPGRRTNENQNAVDAVMTAVSGGGVSSGKLARQLAKQLEVSYRMIKRGEAARASMVDKDDKNWIRVRSKVPSSAIRTGERMSCFPFILIARCT